jgi:septal ring factor EnvC (AmiA/AmiB activator)
MEYLIPVGLLLLGVALGATVAFLFAHTKTRQAQEAAKVGYEPEIARLNERLQGRDATVEALKADLSGRDQSIVSLRAEVKVLTANEAKLLANLDDERKAAAEKLGHVYMLFQHLMPEPLP